MFTRSLAFYIFGGIQMITFFNSDETEYVVIDEFHTNVTGPHNTKISVKVFETVNDVFATDVSIDFKFFLVDDGSYKWAEITKSEFIALRILKRVGDRKISVIEYKPEWSLITVTGDDGFTITDKICADDIDDFLKVVDAMDEIRNGDFYARIKEAKHE